MLNKQDIYRLLDEENVWHEITEHPAAYNNFHDILSLSGSTALRANPAGLSVLLFMYFIIVLHPLARESAAFRTAMRDLTVCPCR